MGVPVALQLDQVHDYQQLQRGQRLVEGRAVGLRHDRVAGVDHHRPDLARPGGGDLVGRLGQGVVAGHRRQAPPGTSLDRPGQHRDGLHDVDVARLEAAPAGPVDPAGHGVEQMAQPLADGARPVLRDAGVGHAHGRRRQGEPPGDIDDILDGHVALGRQVVEVGLGRQGPHVPDAGHLGTVGLVVPPVVEDDFDQTKQERPVTARTDGDVGVGLLGGGRPQRVDHDEVGAGLLGGQHPPPPVGDSSQFMALTAGFIPTMRKHLQASTSGTSISIGLPFKGLGDDVEVVLVDGTEKETVGLQTSARDYDYARFGVSAVGVSFHEDVVVLDEPFGALLVGELVQQGHTLEVGLPRSAGSKQDQERCRLVGLVAEAVDAARWDEEEVTLAALGPVTAVVELHRARQHEERLGHRAVKMRAGPARLRCDVDAVEAVVAVGGSLVGKIVELEATGGVVVRRISAPLKPGTDLRLVLGVAGRGVGRHVPGIPE